MTREEMIQKAQVIRERDRFGTMTPEELAALPCSDTAFAVSAGGHSVTVFEVRPVQLPDGPVPLIINLHGGGFLKPRGDRDRRYCNFLAEELKCLVWDVDYSLAPENPYPCALEESLAILEYAYATAEEKGIDPEKIALAGHSAGGNLTAAVMLRCVDSGKKLPCCALMEYFPVDFHTEPCDKLSPAMREDPFWVRRAAVEGEYNTYYLRSDADRDDPYCAPILARTEALAGFPPCLIVSAGTDTLRQDCESFAQRLLEAGVTVTAKRIPEAVHGFTVNRTEGWERALALHKVFFQNHLS